jgi:hypothetical protein
MRKGGKGNAQLEDRRSTLFTLSLGACRLKSLPTLSGDYSLEFSVSVPCWPNLTRIVAGPSKLIRDAKRALLGAKSGALIGSSQLQTTLAAEQFQ